MESTAAPQNVNPTEFDLYDKTKNSRLATHLISLAAKNEHVHIIPSIHGVVKVEDVGTNAGWLFRVDGETGLLVYVVKYALKNLTIQHRKVHAAMQERLWVDRISSQYDHTLARNAFYGIMLPKTGTVVSDIQQTGEGKRFWLSRIREVLDSSSGIPSLRAYHWDKRGHVEKFIEITRDNSRELLSRAWDDAKSAQMSRLIISDRDLHLPA